MTPDEHVEELLGSIPEVDAALRRAEGDAADEAANRLTKFFMLSGSKTLATVSKGAQEAKVVLSGKGATVSVVQKLSDAGADILTEKVEEVEL